MTSGKRIIGMVLLGILCMCISSCVSKDDRVSTGPGGGKINEIIASMTLEDKVNLVVGTGMYIAGSVYDNPDTLTEKLVSGAAGATAQVPRVGITPMILADGPAGLRINPTRTNDNNTYYCTAFPIGTMLASTWDPEMVQKVGQAIGNEVREYGADVLLAPALNLHRNPLCGRNFEYYSEDPLVVGKTTAAMVKGVQSNGVGTSIKHFAANNQETNRFTVDTIVSERALRELYLEGFRIAVQDAQPWTVMSSYNKINGTYASESHDLLTRILRDDWGFKGLVMTDWLAGSDSISQMKAGNDLLMPGNPDEKANITAAVQSGKLDEKVLNENVGRILGVMLKSPRYRGYKYSNKPDLKAHAQVSRQAATEGMVLLKNTSGALPIAGSAKNIAAFGNTSYDIIKGGTGSGDVNVSYTISLIEGLRNGGYSVTRSLEDAYTNYIKDAKAKLQKATGIAAFMPAEAIAEMSVNAELVNAMAAETDLALVTIGRSSGEFSDRAKDGDFYLKDSEKALIQTVTRAFKDKGKKTIVVLNIGGVIETASWKDAPDAILLAWQPGIEAGNAIVDVLSGKVNPSGKLVDSFPVVYDDVPSARNFPGIERTGEKANSGDSGRNNLGLAATPAEVVYEEDIYVGYRYYSSFNKPVSYEFGYGLSYTQFEYSNLKLSSKSFKDKVTVAVDVKNTGKVAGREVVQIYLSAPARKLNKPSEELVAYGKTELLKPGQSQTLSFVLNPLDLASFDTASSSWVAEAGEYTVKAAASSKDVKQKGTFTLDSELTVKKVSKALTPLRAINTLRP
jgi:beta-glucosidase